MKSFIVGGFVRDSLLGIKTHDKDHVVLGGTMEEMKSLGYKQVGKFFPVFIHPETKEEYALARKEVKVGDQHGDFEFVFTPDITLEDDAMRRDFTINALYQDEKEILDPTGKGLADLKNKVLRHVSDKFIEDPLRVLRLFRFKAQLGFNIDPSTMDLAKDMLVKGMLKYISRERIDEEFIRAMSPGYDSRKFIEGMLESGALRELYPYLANYELCKENIKYHSTGNTLGHVLSALDIAIDFPAHQKTAVLFHDIYKPIAYKLTERNDYGTLKEYVRHDDEDAIKYLEECLSQTRFNYRIKNLCRVSVENHMKIWNLFDGIKAGKWIDLIESITSGFNLDQRYILDDLLEVCKADDWSDKTDACIQNGEDKNRIERLKKAVNQTFDECIKIQGRTIANYQDIPWPKLKDMIRQARIKAVKHNVDYFKQKAPRVSEKRCAA